VQKQLSRSSGQKTKTDFFFDRSKSENVSNSHAVRCAGQLGGARLSQIVDGSIQVQELSEHWNEHAAVECWHVSTDQIIQKSSALNIRVLCLQLPECWIHSTVRAKACVGWFLREGLGELTRTWYKCCAAYLIAILQVKPSFSASSLAHYKIPAWADPHYSASGNDRNFG
jgi:hypothetical protein